MLKPFKNLINLLNLKNKNKSGVTKGNIGKKWVNPFWSNVLFLYLLITSENQRFSDVFRGYRNGTLV